jgi:hypothetical protein
MLAVNIPRLASTGPVQFDGPARRCSNFRNCRASGQFLDVLLVTLEREVVSGKSGFQFAPRS